MMDQKAGCDKVADCKNFEIKWNGEAVSLQEGSTFLNVKKAFGWKNDVLLVGIQGADCSRARELREKVDGDYVVEPLGFESEAAREALRHTASHILAQAVKRLFPEARLGIGPAIEDGFYYDFDTEHGFTVEDLEKIEGEMKRIIKENVPITREVISKDEAQKLFKERDAVYKLRSRGTP